MESWSSMVAALVAGAFILFVFKIAGKSKKKGKRAPGPVALPIIGHMHLLSPKAHQTFDDFCKKYGPIVSLRLGSTPTVIVGGVAAAAEFFKTHDLVFAERVQSIASRRLAYDDKGFAFAPYGAYWKFVKKLAVTDLLSARTVEQLLPVRRLELTALLEKLAAAARRRETVNVSHELIMMTNSTISRMVIGRTCAPAAGEVGDPEESMKLAKQVAELIGSFNVCDHIWFLRHWDLQGLNRRIEDVLSRYDIMIERIIKQKEAAKKAREDKSSGRDLLDILLDASENPAAEVKLTRENVKAIILDLLTAGSDSSAVTLEWALTELINHPEMLKKAQEEVDRVVGKERLVEETDIAGMPYVQAIIRETLRLHPAAVFAGRRCREDVTVCGFHIAAGTSVFVNIWSLGKDPEQWKDPLEFRPERFVKGGDELQQLLQRMMPLGGGRRICPGGGLAMQVVQTTLAALLQCFEWKHVERQDLEEGIGLVVPRANPLVCVPVARQVPPV
ncbi:3,9-dihydroxypterocarpan 6A-monooxygenase-like [Wolffia australiana]